VESTIRTRRISERWTKCNIFAIKADVSISRPLRKEQHSILTLANSHIGDSEQHRSSDFVRTLQLGIGAFAGFMKIRGSGCKTDLGGMVLLL
jgi:hypothetical protein